MPAAVLFRCCQVRRPQHASCRQSVARCYRVSRSCCCPKPDLKVQSTRNESIGGKDTAQSTGVAVPAVGFVAAVTAAMDVAASHAADAAGSTATAGAVPPIVPGSYVPGPVEVDWQIWFAAVVSTVPFVIGAYEFGKRILIQRRCHVCGGSGLVQKGKFPKKCPQCGGFFPWISWRSFLSANARPGNGGPLLQPQGQTSVFYAVPPSSNEAAVQQQQQHSNVVRKSAAATAAGDQQATVNNKDSKSQVKQTE